MGRSLGFASNPCDWIAHLRLAFASPTRGYRLSLPQKLTRRLIMQKARRHRSEDRLRPLVSARFQVLLTSLIGILFTIQSPYWSTIGHRGVFSLGGWAPHIQAEFHELDPTLGLPHYVATGLSPSMVRLSQTVHDTMSLSVFARRYLRNRGCFLFLWLLRCFSSPGSLPYPIHSGMDDGTWPPGFPIQKSTDQSLFASSLWLIAGYNVFHRLSMPRHPPCALSSFITPTSNRQCRLSDETRIGTITR